MGRAGASCAQAGRASALGLCLVLAVLVVGGWGLLRFLSWPSSGSGVQVSSTGNASVSSTAQRLESSALEPLGGGRAAAESTLLPAGPLRLQGSVCDERGNALGGERVHLELAGPARQSLVVPVSLDGSFGPVRLVGGRWELEASSVGHRAVQRVLELRAAAVIEPLELVLQRVTDLDVRLYATQTAPREELDEHMLGLFSLLSLRFEPALDESKSDPPLSLERADQQPGITLRARLRRLPDVDGRLDLRLGGQVVDQRFVPAASDALLWSIDPLELTRRLVDIKLVLFANSGEPLEQVRMAWLSWDAVELTSGQPDERSNVVHFPVCPPGPARLRVNFGEGLTAEGAVFVPFDGPAELELRLDPLPE